jgi:hypothetical protein
MFNSLLTIINYAELNSVKLNYFHCRTKHIVRVSIGNLIWKESLKHNQCVNNNCRDMHLPYQGYAELEELTFQSLNTFYHLILYVMTMDYFFIHTLMRFSAIIFIVYMQINIHLWCQEHVKVTGCLLNLIR